MFTVVSGVALFDHYEEGLPMKMMQKRPRSVDAGFTKIADLPLDGQRGPSRRFGDVSAARANGQRPLDRVASHTAISFVWGFARAASHDATYETGRVV